MAPALGKQPNLHIAPSSQVTRTTAATSSPDTKAHFLRNGHRIAAGYIVAAVLVNHIRRVLAPWFGQFVWRHALEYMKLARSSPHYHLDISLDYEWRGVLYFVAQQYALSLTRRVLTEKLARDARGTGWAGKTMDVCRVLYLVMQLVAAERAYVGSCWAAAQMYAYARVLVWGSEAEREFVQRVLAAKWHRLPVQAAVFAYWLVAIAAPTLKSAVREVRRGRVEWPMALGTMCCGTAYLVRYSNKYFMLLEMRGMLVTWAWMVLGVGYVLVLGLWRWFLKLSRESGSSEGERLDAKNR